MSLDRKYSLRDIQTAADKAVQDAGETTLHSGGVYNEYVQPFVYVTDGGRLMMTVHYAQQQLGHGMKWKILYNVEII